MHNFARALERSGYGWRTWTLPGERECIAVKLDNVGELFVLGVRLRKAGWNRESMPVVTSIQGGDSIIAYWPEFQAEREPVPFP